jgi:glycosyltransferase involved in cell wall biosynthesis
MPTLPKVSPLPTFSRNCYEYAHFLRQFWQSRWFRQELAREVNSRFDLVHFNHESLFRLAWWLRKRTAVPLTMHIRTMDWEYDNVFARLHAWTISRAVDYLVFITENEQASFARIGGERPGTIIYNIAEPSREPVPPHPAIPSDNRLRIACLSNFAWVRGTDRLVEIAEALASKGRRDVLFVVAGRMTLERSLPGKLRRIGRRGGTLADYARERGVADMFLFLGHVPEPERVLVSCDLLAKPTRQDNPWGRDIIEALALGRPVATVGRWDGFVQHGRTGILQPTFDAAALAVELIALADDRGRLAAIGEQARRHVARLCNGRDRAADLLAVWTKLVRA